jgi:GTP cyclohydrolase I
LSSKELPKLWEEISSEMCGAGKRFFACDNVSEYLAEDEREILIGETAAAFEVALRSLLIDVDNDPNSKDTAMRLSKMYWREIFEGRYYQKPKVTAFPNDDEDAYQGMLVVRADIKSVCSHHWQPVNGTAIIGIIPSKNVLGLSKYIRLAQWEARRGTLQEELTQRIAKSISEETESQDVAVHITATHGCCENRGVGASNSSTQTCVLLGSFKSDHKVREEFMDNVKMQLSKA